MIRSPESRVGGGKSAGAAPAHSMIFDYVQARMCATSSAFTVAFVMYQGTGLRPLKIGTLNDWLESRDGDGAMPARK